MIGHTLGDIRSHMEDLAAETGGYYLVCARHGDRPVPATDLSFDERATARAAARATELYRTKLRQYDTQVPYYDVIVCQDVSVAGRRTTTQPTSGAPRTEANNWDLSDRVVETVADNRQDRIEFCHRVAATVFETLTEHEYGAVETAVLESYFDLAEQIASPDELCLRLLERMAITLDEQLPLDQQTTVVTEATAKLSGPATTDRPVETALARLETRGILDSYSHPIGPAADCPQSRRVRLSGYKLTPQDTSLPILPIALELARHRPDRTPPSVRVIDIDDGWQLTLTSATDPVGVVSVPIGTDGSR